MIGSRSILATYPAGALPTRVTLSVEADIAFVDDADDAKSDSVDGAIGEDSMFHQTFGYCGQGVSISTATLPAGWKDRLVSFVPIDSKPAESVCLDPVDLVIAKLVAGREKDLIFAAELLGGGQVDAAELRERSQLLPVIGAIRPRVMATSIDSIVQVAEP